MPPPAVRPAFAILLTLGLFATAQEPGFSQRIPTTTQVDRVFARWTAESPGCAVAVQVGNAPPMTRAYGLANLEHRIPNTPTTIFEAGSVAKQFTAAAILLLAQDGKLSLDDPVRRYLPELREHAAPVTIRHLLTHTSGLRDWGVVADIAGHPRGTRVFTQADVLHIASRQRSLNFRPGTQWSYSNTGYNLAAIIVSRVSQMSLGDFTRTRIFEPLGMTHTSWREDHTRVVPGRADAYAERAGQFQRAMPFEDAVGNGGLLTTVDDLLTWNRYLDAPKSDDRAWVQTQQQIGRFDDGTPHSYAFGLAVGTYKGVREVGHDGATAGYTAGLFRFPDQGVSVGVLCNVEAANAAQYAHEVADLSLTGRLAAENTSSPTVLTPTDLARAVGVYRHVVSGAPLHIEAGRQGIRIARGPELRATSGSTFTLRDVRFDITVEGARFIEPNGRVTAYERMAAASPAAAQLKQYTGTYVSDEADASWVVDVDGTTLQITRRPSSTLALTPLWEDAFSAPPLGTVVFRRDDQRRVTALSVVADRVWDLRFRREDSARP